MGITIKCFAQIYVHVSCGSFMYWFQLLFKNRNIICLAWFIVSTAKFLWFCYPLNLKWFDLNEAEDSFANQILKQQGINFIVIQKGVLLQNQKISWTPTAQWSPVPHAEVAGGCIRSVSLPKFKSHLLLWFRGRVLPVIDWGSWEQVTWNQNEIQGRHTLEKCLNHWNNGV